MILQNALYLVESQWERILKYLRPGVLGLSYMNLKLVAAI